MAVYPSGNTKYKNKLQNIVFIDIDVDFLYLLGHPTEIDKGFTLFSISSSLMLCKAVWASVHFAKKGVNCLGVNLLLYMYVVH